MTSPRSAWGTPRAVKASRVPTASRAFATPLRPSTTLQARGASMRAWAATRRSCQGASNGEALFEQDLHGSAHELSGLGVLAVAHLSDTDQLLDRPRTGEGEPERGHQVVEVDGARLEEHDHVVADLYGVLPRSAGEAVVGRRGRGLAPGVA